MRIEKVVGQNVAALRAREHWSQPELGRRIGEAAQGRAWTRQAVSNAENGLRSYTAADLVTLAFVFGTSPGALMTLPPASRADTIEAGGGTFSRADLENPSWSQEATSAALAHVVRLVAAISTRTANLIDDLIPLQQGASDLENAGHTLAARLRLEEAGVAQPGDYGYGDSE